jgi:hypothetical protein
MIWEGDQARMGLSEGFGGGSVGSVGTGWDEGGAEGEEESE